MPSPSLSLTHDQKKAIIDWVETHLPEEACGMLGGMAGVVRQVIPIPSLSHSPIEFSMDGQAQLAAMQTIEAEALELTAIFHSHPNGPTFPSERDIQTYYYPDSVMLIAAPGNTGWELFAFQVVDSRALQIPINYIPSVTLPTRLG